MDEGREKLWELIKATKIAMLVTEDDGHLRSRPMAGAQSEFDGFLWFLTRASSHKTTEVADAKGVNLSYADPGKQNFVSVSGRATLVSDRSAIDHHWSEAMRVWFPQGKDDPDLAMLKISVDQAEYWDAPSSTMVHAYGYVKAIVTGEPPHPDGHGVVKNRSFV